MRLRAEIVVWLETESSLHLLVSYIKWFWGTTDSTRWASSVGTALSSKDILPRKVYRGLDITLTPSASWSLRLYIVILTEKYRDFKQHTVHCRYFIARFIAGGKGMHRKLLRKWWSCPARPAGNFPFEEITPICLPIYRTVPGTRYVSTATGFHT